ALRNKMDAANDDLQSQARSSEQEAVRVSSRSRFAILAMFGIAVLILFSLALSLTRQIKGRLAIIIEHLKALAEGHLVDRVADTRRDELGEMATFFNETVDRLHGMIRELAALAESVAEASKGLQATSEDTALRAGEQKEQASQVVLAMQEMVSAV